ncbi:MAG: imidazole glycerol phosphate synthase subunit HisH, partial [Rhodobacteraceae bacterium]|nr:imidazole glycerol phosphate synthase subunit HisH [Paracoccaceae bacterium]
EEVARVAARPFLGICVGMQMMATRGLENAETQGFDWIAGEVGPVAPSDPSLKVPHMGWNDLVLDAPHPLWEGLATGDHAYFVHSYQFRTANPSARMAHVDYGGPITAAVAEGNLFGTQFHPEKSQAVGLRLIANFLRWRP